MSGMDTVAHALARPPQHRSCACGAITCLTFFSFYPTQPTRRQHNANDIARCRQHAHPFPLWLRWCLQRCSRLRLRSRSRRAPCHAHHHRTLARKSLSLPPLTDNTIQHATEIRNKCDADNKLYYPGITTCNDTVPYTVANHRRLETPSLITTQIDIKANGDLEVAATETGSRYTLQNLHSGKEGVDTRVKQVIQNVNLQRERIRQARVPDRSVLPPLVIISVLHGVRSPRWWRACRRRRQA